LEVNTTSAMCNKEPLVNLHAAPLDQNMHERSGLVISKTTTIMTWKIGGK
jgi:hypothetical protein